jgi:hypothetical protein
MPMQCSGLMAAAVCLVVSCAVCGRPANAAAATNDGNGAVAEGGGSAGFCLFELPLPSAPVRRLINLSIVQYVELTGEELRIYYGAGNLGNGHEAKMPLKSREQGLEILSRMRQTARNCK